MKPFNRVDLISPDIIREGDRVNYFLVRLTDSTGSPVDVSNSNVTWSMANKKGRVIADKTADKTNDLGVIKLRFTVGDQTGYGKFEVQIEVENGSVSEFYPSDNSLEVFIPKNINNLEHTPVAYIAVKEFQDSVDNTLQTSEEAKVQSEQAKQKADSTKELLDEIILESGTSDAEVVQARGDFNLLNDRLSNAEKKVTELTLNASSFGLTGTGASNDYQKIQNALNFAESNGYSEVFLPPGVIDINSTVYIPSNTTLRGSGEKTIIRCRTSAPFRFWGELESPINLSQNAGLGSTSISLVDTTSIKPGDYLLLLSQRAANTNDAGDMWRLGTSTPSVVSPVFGEFVRAKTKGNGAISLRSSLIFPSYRTDKSQETSSSARDSSTVQKVNPCINAHIKNLRFEGDDQASLTFVSMQYAINCTVDNVTFLPSANAACIDIRESLKCKGTNCRAYFEPETVANPYYTRNAFKVASGQYCGYQFVDVENGSQTFDITYRPQTLPSVKCFVRDCTNRGSTDNAFTSHGGTYAVYVQRNIFEECEKNGIACRSRSSIIEGNTVSGSLVADSYGINIFDGWARDCIVSHNVITMFDHALTVRDGAPDREGYFEWVGASFIANTILHCVTGLKLHRWAGRSGFTKATGIRFEMNNFTTTDISLLGVGVNIDPYYAGVTIKDNIFRLRGSGTNAVISSANTNMISILDNEIHDNRQTAFVLYAPTDSNVEGKFYTQNNREYTNGALVREDAFGTATGTKRSGMTTHGIQFFNNGSTAPNKEGFLRWNASSKKFQVYDGTAWKTVQFES